MGQSKFSKLDGVSFDPENYANTQITINHVDGTLVFQDEEIAALKLSQLVGFENIENVFLVGKAGSGARYKTIQDAIDAVSVTSSYLEPSVIIVTAGVYQESLTIQKDGLHIIGMGRVALKGDNGSPSVLIDDLGAVIPQVLHLENLIIEKDQNGESCVEVSGSLDTTLLQKGLTLKNCSLEATGIGSYPIKADKVNSITVIDGTWGNSRLDSICFISQVAYFHCVGLQQGTDFQMSYDDSADAPLTKTSEYIISSMLGSGNFLVSLLGTGSLTVNRSTIGDLSITGDRTLSVSDSETMNLTVQGTTACSVRATKHGTIGGDVTATLSLSELRDSVDLIGVVSVSVPLPLPYPNSFYMVALDGYDGSAPYVTNKTDSSFDIVFPDGLVHTTTVHYQVIL